MVVLDTTVVNIALPSAQRALGFGNADRQWVVTAYALGFGSLLLLGGRLGDVYGRRTTLLIGLTGFAVVSAIGGATQNFAGLVSSRAAQGVFGALLAPAVLSLMSTTFTDAKERAKAFGVFGVVSGTGGAVGLLLGGVLTEYLSWRWCLYINLPIAAIAIIGATVLLPRQARSANRGIDLPGVVAVVVGLVGLVYGLAHAESGGWGTPVTVGSLALGAVSLTVFVLIEVRAPRPLLPLRVVLDRDRGGAYLTMAIVGAGMFAVFLFLSYYMSQALGFSPVRTGLGFLPMVAALTVTTATIGTLLLPRTGPRPLIPAGMLLAAVGMVLLTRLDLHSTYAGNVLPSLLCVGFGLGLVFAPAINTSTAGVPVSDVGAASAMVNTSQQVGGSIGTALLSTLAANAATHYLAGRAATPVALAQASLNSYTTAFAAGAVIFAGGAVVCAALLRSGPVQIVAQTDLDTGLTVESGAAAGRVQVGVRAIDNGNDGDTAAEVVDVPMVA